MRIGVKASLVGLAAAILSLSRILLVNHSALSDLLWAEDGLFPLCVRKVGFLACLADPFAGYALGVPRTLAGIVALFPMGSWPLVAQLLAAATTGALSAVAFWSLSRVLRSTALAILISLLPVILPIVGQEVTTTIGSIYIPMVVTASYLTAFPIRTRAGQVTTAILLALTVLTIPTAVFLLIPIALAAWSRSITRRCALVWSAILGAGLVLQVLALLSSRGQREGAVSVASALAWVDGLTSQLLTNIPFMNLPESVVNFSFPISLARLSALAILLGVGVISVFLIRSRTELPSGIAGILIVGLLLSAAPVIAGVPNPRYYVLTVILLTAGALIGIDRLLPRRSSTIGVVLVCAIAALLWVPHLPAAKWRATADPKWAAELDQGRKKCSTSESVSLLFSPHWPESGLRLSEPTTPTIACDVLTR